MANVKLKFINRKTGQIAECGDIALFINGEFQASWHRQTMPDDIEWIESYLSAAYDSGYSVRSREIGRLLSDLISEGGI